MRFEHFALNVADPVAQAAWYVQHLGLRVVRAVEEPPYTRFLADEAGQVIEIYGHTKAPVPNYAAQDPLVLHLALVAADIPATRDRLLAAGATPAGEITQAPNGDELLFLRDPWGVALQLCKRATPLV